MTKRFGRNQKRKLRDRITQLEAPYQMEGAVKARIRRERDQLSQTLVMVEHVLGKYFSGLPAKTMAIRQQKQKTPFPFVNIHINDRFEASAQLACLPVDMRCEQVQCWLLNSYTHLDAARGCVHVVLDYQGAGGLRAGYMISESALETMHLDELAYRIAPELAGVLQQALRSHGTRA